MFRGRGDLPGIDLDPSSGETPSSFFRFFSGRYIIIHYDKTFVAMELITTLLLTLSAFFVYLFAYPITFNDPIADIKKTFLTSQLICVGVSILLIFLTTFLSKTKESLMRNLKIIAVLSLIAILVNLGIKINLDNKYNIKTFGEFYDTYEAQNHKANDGSKRISTGLSGIKVLDVREAYIQDSINAYSNFKMKTMLYIILHILVLFFDLYLLYRLVVIEAKQERLRKDDIVVYDDEENIKM